MSTMKQFRKKPVVVEAVRVEEVLRAARLGEPMPLPLAQAAEQGKLSYRSVGDDLFGAVTIWTLEGEMRAEKGDWIIRGVAGELYPCKPEIFEKTYEPMGEGLQ